MCRFPWSHKYTKWVTIKAYDCDVWGNLKMIQQKRCIRCNKVKLRSVRAG